MQRLFQATWPLCLPRLVTIALTAILMLPASAADGRETLSYEVIYRGVFSLGQDLPIAALTLATDTTAVPGGVRVGLQASSAGYEPVESAYPLRYRFRSWADAATGHLMGFETYEKTRREKHRLYLRDASPRGVRRIEPDTCNGAATMRRLDGGIAPSEASASPLFDRLGVLQRVRAAVLEEGAQYSFPVTDGRRRLAYRVSVERATTLTVGGLTRAAWKLRLDADERDHRGRKVAAHRPVYIWLSRDRQRRPLRVDVRHAIGLFRVQLVDPPITRQIAAQRR